MKSTIFLSLAVALIATALSLAVEKQIEDVYIGSEAVAREGEVFSVQKGHDLREAADPPYKLNQLIVRFAGIISAS